MSARFEFLLLVIVLFFYIHQVTRQEIPMSLSAPLTSFTRAAVWSRKQNIPCTFFSNLWWIHLKKACLPPINFWIWLLRAKTFFCTRPGNLLCSAIYFLVCYGAGYLTPPFLFLRTLLWPISLYQAYRCGGFSYHVVFVSFLLLLCSVEYEVCCSNFCVKYFYRVELL